MTLFQIASDLHLEFYKKQSVEITPSAPYLILAGDIGYPFDSHYTTFLSDITPKFKQIFIIAGNHEYYQGRSNPHTKEEIDQEIERICQSYPNINYLNNRSYILEEFPNDAKIVILGTTLWTHIPVEDQKFVLSSMNDYRKIYKEKDSKKTLIGIEDTNTYHKKDLEWLESEIRRYKDQICKVIVVTHHLPSSIFIHPTYRNHPLESAFMTDLEYLMKEPIVAWIAGHTHCSIHESYKDIECVVNPLGYPGENPSFRRDLTIKI